MNRDPCRRHESQPALARAGTRKFQDVAEEGRRRLDIMRGNSDDRRSGHLPSVRLVAPQSKDADQAGIPRFRCTTTSAQPHAVIRRKLAAAASVEEESARLDLSLTLKGWDSADVLLDQTAVGKPLS